MEQLERELDIGEPLARPSAGAYLIPLNNDLSVTVTFFPHGFSLLSEFAETPKENEETVYTEMLNANLFGQGTRGATLGMNDRGNLLTISRVVDYNIEYRDFKELIEDFINTIDFWKERVHSVAN